MDHQVKIRGYRIELGEIQNHLVQLEGIEEAFVTVREEQDGHKALCAYFSAAQAVDLTEIREQLSKELPSYMVPAYFVQVEQMPLTANGKVDRKALPDPSESMQLGTELVAPRNEAEEVLVRIWQDVLGAKQIGIKHHFFELGGDSIKAIQVASRLNQAGYKLEIKDLFKHPRIADLSALLQPLTIRSEQGVVQGDVFLTPIQKWFFEQQFAEQHHWNQSVMLARKEGFDEKLIRQVFQRITEHHDALRMVFRSVEDEWRGWNRGLDDGAVFDLEVFDVTREPAQEEELKTFIEQKVNEIQRSIDLSTGPLVKLGLFHTPAGDHLLIVIHHLVVDGLSWRILFEDIATAYGQASTGSDIALPAKTDSVQYWSAQLQAYASHAELQKERAYWQAIEANSKDIQLPRDFISSELSLVKDCQQVSISLDQVETQQLLREANKAFNTEINDLLLTALGLTIAEWSKSEQIVIHLEGHGREPIVKDMDINRTVGWFTTQYPVLLELSDEELDQQIIRVKERLHQIPNKGIGYGILTYLSDSFEQLDDRTPSDVKKPEISFNYLGQFDQDLPASNISMSMYSSGTSMSPRSQSLAHLNVNGLVVNQELHMTFDYSTKEYKHETIERLAQQFKKHLLNMMMYCLKQEKTTFTPCDMVYQKLTLEQFNALRQEVSKVGNLENLYPLSPMQQGMFFHTQADPDSVVYFEQISFDIEGDFEPSLFERSVQYLMERHEILRTVFSIYFDQPLQIVLEDQQLAFTYQNLIELNSADQKRSMNEYKALDRVRGFELSQGPLIRIALFQTDSKQFHLLWSFHHILMDGWCIPILLREVCQVYQLLLEDEPLSLPHIAPYSDYIEWLTEQNRQEAIEYWKKYLADYEQRVDLPLKKQKQGNEYVLEHLEFSLGEEMTAKLNQMARTHKVTINILLQTAWGVLLQKYNHCQDVVFGSVVSGRPSEIQGIEEMLGLFINTIPVRIRVSEGDTFEQSVLRNQEHALNSAAYDFYPLYDIQSETGVHRDFVNHLMVFENYPVDQQLGQMEEFYQLPFQMSNIEAFEQTNYDFNLVIIPGNSIQVRFKYNARVYEQENMNRIQTHFLHVLQQVLSQPSIEVGDVAILTETEKEKLYVALNDTQTNYPKDKTLHQLFEEQVELTPENIAIEYEKQVITYRELNNIANQMALVLREKGVQRNDIVAVLFDRSIEMMVSLLAILKAGGAYMPIDPNYPEERISYMLDDSQAKWMVTTRKRASVCSTKITLLIVEDMLLNKREMTSNPPHINVSSDLANVIYTSGSTGKPKGSLISHFNVSRVVLNTNYIQITEGDHILHLLNYAFDGSTFDIYGALLNGATLVLVLHDTVLDHKKLAQLIALKDQAILLMTTSLFNTFVDMAPEGLSHAKKILVGGEKVSVAHMKKAWQFTGPNVLINVYGPTESTVFATTHPINDIASDALSIPIGKPISNTEVFIVDPQGALLPIGIPGELCLAGDGLAQGYLNNPALTAERFISHPFEPEKRMYRTGDRARYLPDGTIDYIERMDQQVKIRGYRIELGEIEAQLLKMKELNQATVVVRGEQEGQKYLAAYITSDRDLDIAKIREELAKSLPSYMIPAYMIQLDELPLTRNGKLDQKALPEPTNMLQSTDYVAPRNEGEEKLSILWREVLGLSVNNDQEQRKIGIHDHFFELGGHSLKATLLVAKIHREFQVEVQIKDVFEYPTLELMARHIAHSDTKQFSSIQPAQKKEFYSLSSAQKRIYILSMLEGGDVSYNMPGALKIEGKLDQAAFTEVCKKLISRHEAFRTSFDVVNGEPMQMIHSDVSFEVEFVQAEEEQVVSLINDFIRPFDLRTAPLFRVKLVQLAEESYVMIFDMHHVISDGTSMNILTKEFAELYAGQVLPELRIQYKDYSEWQNGWFMKEDMQRQKEFWLDMFSKQPALLNMPLDYPRPPMQSFEGKTISLTIEQELKTELQRMATETGTTLYMVLLSAYNVLLSTYTGQEDVVVGTPVAGRNHAEVMNVIGMFVNTLALRNYPEGKKTFLEFLHEVKESTLSAFEHQDYPFEELVEHLDLMRDMSRHALFDTMFSMQNSHGEGSELAGLSFRPYEMEQQVSKFDFTLHAEESSDGVELTLEYCRALFTEEKMVRFLHHFVHILHEITLNPVQRISEISVLTEAEKHTLLVEFNDTQAEYPQEVTFHALFEEQVLRTPDQVAVRLGEQCLSYKELNERANQLARALREYCIQPNEMVGIMMERSLEMVIGVMAILKAGGAYLPLDPSYPEERFNIC
nr:non-ribosomal peptide synthetase [Caldalkalibacillus mannanilyticus]